MEDLAYKLNLSTKQLFAVIGFVVILISIPLSFSLVKSSQIFRSRADELSNSSSTAKVSSATASATQLKEIPANSPLDDLSKAVQENTSAPGNSTLDLPSLNTAFGPTLNIKVAVEGRPADNQAAKVFIGIAPGTTTTKPSYAISFTVDFPASGIFQGLSLAGLNPGSTYTAYIKGPGQVDSGVTFVMGPTETSLNNGQAVDLISGDLNEDNTINSADYTIAKNLYGTTSASLGWNNRADFNADGVINNFDLAFITKNMGKTGASGTWISTPPVATSSATPATGSAVPNGGYESPNGASSPKGYWFWMPAL